MYSSDFPHLRILKKEKKIWYIEKHFLGVCVSMLKKKKKKADFIYFQIKNLYFWQILLKDSKMAFQIAVKAMHSQLSFP